MSAADGRRHLIDPWVCPPCRRGEHASCMEPAGAKERICHCTSCAPPVGRPGNHG